MKTDEQLVTQALSGDVTAYSELIERYMNVLYALGYHLSGDFHLAQDITQEALIKGYAQLSSLHDPDKFGSWIYTIAHRTGLDMLRKSNRERKRMESLEERENPRSMEDIWDETERRIAVWQALGKLSDLYRETAILHFMSGMSAGQIAKIMKITVSAVESRLRRAKQQLKRELYEFAGVTLGSTKLGEAFVTQIITLLLRQVNCFYLPVKDPYNSALWYHEHFGLNIHSSIQPGCSGGSISIGSGMSIYLLKSEVEDVKPFDLLSFEVDSLEQLAKHLRKQGVALSSIQRGSDQLCCRFKDPDGHQFMLIEKIH